MILEGGFAAGCGPTITGTTGGTTSGAASHRREANPPSPPRVRRKVGATAAAATVIPGGPGTVGGAARAPRLVGAAARATSGYPIPRTRGPSQAKIRGASLPRILGRTSRGPGPAVGSRENF